jgi:uncharacterized coiled-coil protein SlyX
MAKQVQYRRGTTAQHASFTGAQGEITVDTSKNVVIVHDGSTTGGIPMATNAEVVSLSTLLFSNAAVQASALNTLSGNAVAQSQAIDIINANVAAANAVINAVGNLQNITTAIGPDSSGTRDLGFADRQWRNVFISANVNTGNINAGKYYFANGASFGLDGVTASITTLTANAAAQAVSIADIYANLTVVALQGNVQITNANVSAANARILTLETDLGLAQTDITNLGTNAATQQTQIDTLQLAQLGANADIVAVNVYAQSYANQAITNLVNGAPAALDTLYEIANSLGNNASLSTTVINTIANVQANVTAANAAITTLDANLGTATTNITTLFSNAATQTQLINTLNANVAAANIIISSIGSGTIDAINANVTAANASVAGVQANVTAANARINTLDANLGTATTNITTLFSNAATQYSEIDGIRANVTAANVAIAGIVAGTGFATVTQLDTNVQAISANLGTVTNNITTLFGNAASQAGDISQIISDVGALQGNSASQQSEIIGLQANSVTLAGDIGTVSSAQTGFNLSLQLLDSNVGTIVGTTIPGLISNITAANSAIQALDANIGTIVGNTIPGLQTQVYANANVAAYLLHFDGDIEFTSSTAKIGNVDVITVMDSVRSPAYQFSNGVNILTTVTGTYANANVASYLPTYSGNVRALNFVGATQAQVGSSFAYALNAFGTGSDTGGVFLPADVNSNAIVAGYTIVSNAGVTLTVTSASFVAGSPIFVSVSTTPTASSFLYPVTVYSADYSPALPNSTLTVGNATVANNQTIGGNLTVSSKVTINSTDITVSPGNGALVVAGGVSIGGNLHVAGNVVQQSAYYETYANVTNSGGNLTCNFVNGSTFYATLTANVTVNFTNVVATAGRVTGATLIVDQGATAYGVANIQINSGGIQTVKYAGGTPNTGTASNTDVMSFSLISLDGTNWRVLGQISNYG